MDWSLLIFNFDSRRHLEVVVCNAKYLRRGVGSSPPMFADVYVGFGQLESPWLLMS